MVQGVPGKKRFLVRFQDGCKNNLSLNQLTVMILEKIPEEKEPAVSEIAEIPEEQVKLEKGYYHCVYVILRFRKEVDVESKEDQVDVEDEPDEEEMDDVNFYDERERHWKMVFEDNAGGVDYAKALIHARRWDVYVNEKGKLVKGGYLVEVVGHDGKKVLSGVVNDHVVEELADHDEIGLQGFHFKFSGEGEKGVGTEGSSEFPSLLILIKVWPVDWKTQLNMTNQKADEDNGKALVKEIGWHRKVCRFSINEFWKNIGCLVSAVTFGTEGLRLWEKEDDINISVKNTNRCSISIKVYLYKVCLSGIIYCLLFYFKTILIPFLSQHLSGISLTRGKEFRGYWTKVFELEEDKAIYEWWRAKVLIDGMQEYCCKFSECWG